MTNRGTADSRPFDDVGLLDRLHNCPEILRRVADSTGSELGVQSQLRREFDDDLVRAALLLHDLRRRATAKFSRADRMWFDRTGLEQSTSEPVARWKAARFPAGSEVVDLCTGIGADAIAIATRGPVNTVDTRESAARMTTWNAEAFGVANQVTTLTANAEDVDLAGRCYHIDPDRRAGVSRSLRIEDHQPGLEFLQALTTLPQGGAIKLSPASNFGGKFPGCEIELVSLNGECKEAVVWSEALRKDFDWRATVLPAGRTLTGDPWSAVSEQSPCLKYLYDPDPAVVRAGLVDVLCETTGLKRLDREEEYLTSDVAIDSPFAQRFAVIEVLSNNDREIRNWFRGKDVGQVEIKCRRIPVVPEKVRKQLPLDGRQSRTLIFARIAGRAHAVIARRD